MPCKDVTELIHIEVDASDCLHAYRFTKRTCGQGVGMDTLLMPMLGGVHIDAIQSMDPMEFIVQYPVAESIEEFLNLKHLIAIQSTLGVLTGKAPGGKDAICAAAEIAFEDDLTVIDGVISVDLVTEEIKSCGNCKGCGTVKKAKKKAVVVFN